MGIKNESMKGVTQAIIRTADREYVFDSPDVNIMTVQGQKTYQLTGEPAERPLGETAAAPIPEEDINWSCHRPDAEGCASKLLKRTTDSPQRLFCK